MNSSVLLLSATPRNDKLGWYHQFQKCNVLLSNSKAKTLIVSDSLVSNVSRYPEIWRKPFINNGTFIFDIPGDKVINVLLRVYFLHFWSNLNFFFFFILYSSAVNSFNSLQSSNSNSSTSIQMFFADSLLKSKNSFFPLRTTSTQNPCFSPDANKSSVASASVINV